MRSGIYFHASILLIFTWPSKIFWIRIQDSIKSVVNDVFSNYSDFGKELKQKLSDNVMIENYIKKETTKLMNEQHQKLIDERLVKF